MSQVSFVYAEGLLELAKEEALVEVFKKELDDISLIYRENDLRPFFASAKIGKNAKKDLIEKAFKDRVNLHILNFMKLLIDKSRMDCFEDIVKDYHKLSNKILGIKEGVVESARPLEKEDIEKLQKALSKDVSVILRPRINKTLISGFKVIFDDEVIDLTMREQLENLRGVLLERR